MQIYEKTAHLDTDLLLDRHLDARVVLHHANRLNCRFQPRRQRCFFLLQLLQCGFRLCKCPFCLLRASLQ